MRLPPELEAFRIPVAPPPQTAASPKWLGMSADELLVEVRAEKARRSLWDFLRYGWHVIEPGCALEEHWHLKAICDHVQYVLEGWLARRKQWYEDGFDAEVAERSRNLLVNAPPGVIKSRIVSVYAHAWMWLHAPDWRVTALSVNPRVADRDAGYAYDLITSEWYQSSFKPTWEMRGDRTAVRNFGNSAGGWRQSLGWNAKTVGQRGDALIIDDPNDPEEAYSDTKRKAVNSKWKRAHANRVNDQRTSLRLAIQQRTHDDDWSNTFIRECGENLIHLRLPTLFVPEKRCRTSMPVGRDEAGKPIGWCDPRTQPDEVIHPARFTPEVLEYERRLGSMRWAAQHQQDPDAAGGAIFKRRDWRWYKPDGVAAVGVRRPEGCRTEDEIPAIPLPAKMDWYAITVDAAFKKTEDGSRVSVQVWAGRKADRFMIDNVTKPMGFNDTVAAIRYMRAKYPLALRVYIEDKANGTAIVEQLQREMTGVIAVEPKGGKEARAYSVQPGHESHNYYLPEGAAWLEGEVGFMEEVSKFPNGTKDDQVDAMTQVLVEMQMPHDMARTLMLSEF